MNTYKVMGSVVRNITHFFTNVLKFRNIKSIEKEGFNTININMKNNSTAQIRLLSPGERCIVWSVNDFIQVAMNKEGDNWKEIYDETLFEIALEEMINNHDANHGIHWETISYYIENCKKIKVC